MKNLIVLAALAFAVSACAHKDDDEEQGGGDRVELELQDQSNDTA